MKKSDIMILFLVGLILFGGLAVLQKVPGYMDSEYYFLQAKNLVKNKSLDEPFIWNYLNDPASLPVKGNAFWMPLTSFLAAVGLFIFNTDQFFGAKVSFIIMAAVIPVMAAWLTEAEPETTSPSTAILSPERTKSRSPTFTCSKATVISQP